MEAESTKSTDIYDVIGWVMSHAKQLLIGVGVVAVIGLGVGIYVWNKQENEMRANEELFSPPLLGRARRIVSDRRPPSFQKFDRPGPSSPRTCTSCFCPSLRFE